MVADHKSSLFSLLLIGAGLASHAIAAIPGEPRLVAQLGHGIGTYDLAFSPSGTQFATTGRGGAALLWDVASARQLRAFGQNELEVDISADGQLIATGGSVTRGNRRSGHVRVWATETGAEIRRFETRGVPTWVRFASDGSRVVASEGTGRTTVTYVWDVESGDPERLENAAAAKAVSSDGQLLLILRPNGTADVVGIDQWRLLQSFAAQASTWRSAAFAPDSRTIAIGDESGVLTLFDIATAEVKHRFDNDGAAVWSMAFSADGRRIAAGSNNAVRLWSVETGELVDQRDSELRIRALAFSPDGHLLIGRDGLPGPEVYDAITGESAEPYGATTGVGPVAAALSADNRLLVVGQDNGRARVWDLKAGRPTLELDAHDKTVDAIVVTADGRGIVTGSGDGARLWDAQTGQPLRDFDTPARSIVLSADGRTLVTAAGLITVWDFADARIRHRFGGQWGTYQISLSPDGEKLLTGGDGEGKGAHLWHLASGEELMALNHGGYVASAVTTPDGLEILTSGGFQPVVRIWDAASGEQVGQLQGHAGAVHTVAVSPDGTRAVTGSGDASAIVWDLATRDVALHLRGHTDRVSATYSADGRLILTWSETDKSIRLWDATTGEELVRLMSFSDGTWATVDPDGRYDASNAGDIDGLHWVVANEPISLDQLKEMYYDPHLLAKVLGFDSEPLRVVPELADLALFPAVELTEPSQDDPKVRITLTNRGGGIGRVTVSINGKEITADARGPSPDSGAENLTLEWSLENHPNLIPGQKNVIQVRAMNADGYLSSRGFTVSYEPPGQTAIDPPTLWAIVAGVSDYAGDAIDLRYAANDAEAMARALTLGAMRLFGADRVRLVSLTSRDPESLPTKANIRNAFAAARAAKPWDIMVVYLAGHGVALGDTYYYLTQEAGSTNLSLPAVREQVTISSEELVSWIKESPALKQVMALDTCAAGAAGAKLVEPRNISSDQIRAIERLKDRTGFHVLMGSAADAVSYEATQFEQGLLTYALLQGMQGAALREEQYIDIGRLFQHAADAVPRFANQIGGVQRPQIMAPKGTSFDIGQLTADDRQQIRLAESKPILLRPNLQNATTLFDDLELSLRLRRHLREVSYASPGDAADGLPVVFVDAEQLSGAIRPSGTYRVSGTEVIANLVLVRDGSVVDTIEVRGDHRDIDAFVGDTVTQVARAASRIN